MNTDSFKTDFSKFANVLRGYIGDTIYDSELGRSRTYPVEEFTEDLFRNITVYDDGNSFPEYVASTYRSYFSGQNDISGIAKKISKYVSRDQFTTYIESLGQVEFLCALLEQKYPDSFHAVTAFDVGERLSHLFATIIADAATATRKSTTHNPKQPSSQKQNFPTNTIDFFEWCLDNASPIAIVCLSFYEGIDWLTNSKYTRLLNRFFELNIPLKIVICSSSNHVLDTSEKITIPMSLDETLLKWRIQCQKYTNIELYVSSHLLLHRSYIIHFQDGTGIASIRNYAYAYSEAYDYDDISIIPSNDPAFDKYVREFDYIISQSD